MLLLASSFLALSLQEPAAIESVTVTGRAVDASAEAPARQGLDPVALEAVRPASLADALKLSGAASLSVNSRGETLVYLRNAGERQTALFFDGAPINLPFDNRLDLTLFPAAVIGGLDVTPGGASLLYGVNSSGGVIEIRPPFGEEIRTGLEAGSGGTRRAHFGLSREDSAGALAFAASHARRDSLTGPDGDLGNTDLRRSSAFLRLRRDHQRGAAAFSLLHVQAEQGVQAEDLDRPGQGAPRYWRLPQSDHTLAVLRASHALAGGRLEASLWGQSADQAIERYASEAYADLQAVETGGDRAAGARLLYDRRLGPGEIRFSLSGIEAAHRQTMSMAGGESRARFEDRRISWAGEYERDLAPQLSLLIGLGGDQADPLETGGRPEAGSFRGWNGLAGLDWRASEHWTIGARLSRKQRLPTQRELYATALGRFLANPALQPETLVQAELTARFERERWAVVLTPFYGAAEDVLDQRRVEQGGEVLRQRVNIEGSHSAGLEARLTARPAPDWRVDGHVLATHLRRKDAASGLDYIAERPALIARLSVRHAPAAGLGGGLELEHRGRAYSSTDEGVFEPLDISTTLNAGLDWTSGSGWMLWARGENLTGETVEPQLGLFNAGPLWRAGIRWRR